MAGGPPVDQSRKQELGEGSTVFFVVRGTLLTRSHMQLEMSEVCNGSVYCLEEQCISWRRGVLNSPRYLSSHR